MTLLQELFTLPEDVTKTAFVVKLADAVGKSEELWSTYALTPYVVTSLDAGLSKVRAALEEKRNVAAFVHGSFGAGKSHFMGALSLLLANDTRGWQEPPLHATYAKHPWVKTRKLLRLHANLIGAESLGDCLFGVYLRTLRELHPEAPLCPVFADEALFANAEALRDQMGDAAFFDKLQTGAKKDARWGKKAEAGWTRESFDRARSSGDPKVRGTLFSDLVKSLFPAFQSQTSSYLPFDQGMIRLCRHASDLGYEGIVFFLDELVLWLASKAGEPAVMQAEVQKLARLVEGQTSEQTIPVVTFAARQRDVSELVGEQWSGQDAKAVKNSLQFWEGRFDILKLPDSDLPAIIAKRVVMPRDANQRQRLTTAFDEMRRTLGPSWQTLLGEGGTEEAFRRVYPFTPALVEVLVAMSHYLQRERTALKLLVELLVDQLDDFTLGRVVPVGDLYDALAEGEEPMDGAMRARFGEARRLYTNELLPVIHQDNGTGTPERCQRLREDGQNVGCANCPETACRNDNRIAKTLLLASLAPETPALKNLTARTLVQLNHGTLKSPIAGKEAGIATSKIRGWATQISALRVGDGENPVITTELGGVDLREYFARVSQVDSPGNRKQRLRKLLFTAFGMSRQDVTTDYSATWRNTERKGSIHFGNVREMDDTLLSPREGEVFRVVVDYPFDEIGHTPQEDEARIAKYQQEAGDAATVVWLPSFFSEPTLRELGELLLVEQLLDSAVFREQFGNLRQEEQTRAKQGLASLQAQKEQRLIRALDSAYGVVQKGEGVLDASRSVDSHFHLLLSGKRLTPPLSATLDKSLVSLIHQLLDHRYPRHPALNLPPTRNRLEKELEWVRRLAVADNQRVVLEKEDANALKLATDLELIVLRDGIATPGLAVQRIEQDLNAQNKDVPLVGAVRKVLDPHGLVGLPKDVQDFQVLAFAALRNREIMRGSEAVVAIGKLTDDAELTRPRLPAETAWHAALERAGKIFGLTSSKQALVPQNVRALAQALLERGAAAEKARAGDVAALLAHRGTWIVGDAPRLLTARAVSGLLVALRTSDPVARIEALASCTIASSEAAMAAHVREATATANALSQDGTFTTFPVLASLGTPAAEAILQDLRKLLSGDELVQPLPSRLADLSVRAQHLLASVAQAVPAPQPVLPPQPVAPPPSTVAEPAAVVSAAVPLGAGDPSAPVATADLQIHSLHVTSADDIDDVVRAIREALSLGEVVVTIQTATGMSQG